MHNLPSNWQVKSLGEVAEFLDSQRIPVKEEDRAKRVGPYPYYGANGQVGWIDDYIFDEPLVLLAEDGGNFGSKEKPITYKIVGKSWVNNHAHVLRAKQNCNIDYLHRVLSFYDLSKILTGTTRQKLRKGDAEKIPIRLPPLPIQKQISEILEKADQAKRKRKEAKKLTDQFLQSVFIEMFGDPVKNPKRWTVKKFGDIFSSIRYGTGSPPAYVERGIPFIRATNIKNNTIVRKDLVFITREEATKIKKCELKEGNLIVVRSGVNTGDAAVVSKEFDGTYAAYDLIIELEITQSVFYSFLINSKYGKAIIEPLSRRAGQPHLNAEQLKEIEFYFPPLSLQQQFVEIVNKTEALKEKQKQSEQELENLFQSLMQRAFKGELVLN